MKYVVLLAVSLPGLGAQTDAVNVRVTDVDGKPISGATVSLYNNWNRKIRDFSTNLVGEVVLTRPPYGEWHFTVVARGFAPDALALNICDRRDQTFHIKLPPAPPEADLNTITVEASTALLKLDPMPYCDALDLSSPRKPK